MQQETGKKISTRKLRVGDVITCKDLAYCDKYSSGQFVFDAATKECANGNTHVHTSLKHVDKKRGEAQFIVVECDGGGYSQEQGGGERFSGDTITAQRLHRNGKFNPRGERVSFSSDFGRTDQIKSVRLIRRMQKTFV